MRKTCAGAAEALFGRAVRGDDPHRGPRRQPL